MITRKVEKNLKRNFITILVLIFTQFFCAACPHPPFPHTHWYTINYKRADDKYDVLSNGTGWLLGGKEDLKISLSAEALYKGFRPIKFYGFRIRISCMPFETNNVPNIRKEESLVLIVDGEEFTFSIEKDLDHNVFIQDYSSIEQYKDSPYYENYKKNILLCPETIEEAWYNTSFDFIDKISNAKQVEVILYGENDRIEKRYFSDNDFIRLKLFIDFCNNGFFYFHDYFM
jgi:hypothetical protein